MILEEAFAGLLSGIVLLGGGFLSALALSNLNPEAPAILPLRRMNGLLILGAAVLFFGTGWLGARLLIGPEEEPGLPLLLGLTAAGGLAAWGWLFAFGGPIPRATSSPGFLWTTKAYLGFLPVYVAAAMFNTWLVGLVSDAPSLPEQPVVTGMKDETGLPLVVIVGAAALVQPVLEEVLFRGYLWRFLAARDDFGPLRALIFTTIVFTVAHGTPEVWLPIALLGVFFAWVYWRTGSIVQAIYAHALHNGIAAVLVMIL